LRTRVKKAFSEKQIAKRISKLGAEIRKDAGKAEVFLLGVLKGASLFLADLMRAMPGDVSYGYINVVREMADTEIASAMEIDYLHWSDIAGKHVYLLKDVVSTGVIESYLLQQLKQKNPAELKLVALVDRPELRTVALEEAGQHRDAEVEALLPRQPRDDAEHRHLAPVGKAHFR